MGKITTFPRGKGENKMHRICKLIVVLAVFLLAIPSAGLTEEPQKNVPQEKAIVMDEVVVTATKTAEKRKDVPTAIIIKDVIDIQESTARSVGELVSGELGIDWRSYEGYGGAAEEIHIRGMSGDATQVFMNGVNVNSPSLGIADVAKIPLNSIERIEIVKGSGSLLYGTGAMGGTVNIITKSPQRDKIDLKASAGYGSQNTYQLMVENGMFITKDFGYYLTASRKETDGFRDNSDLTHNDVSLKLVYDRGALFNVNLYGDYIDREYGRPGVEPPEGTHSFYARGVRVYSSDAASTQDRGSDTDKHLVLEVASAPTQWIGFKLHTDYTHMKNYNLTRYYNSWTGGVPGGKTWTTNEVSTTEGTVEIKPVTGASVLLGADYKDYNWKNENVDLDDDGNVNGASRQTTRADLYTRGAFIEGQYRPIKYFKVLAGVRHEDHSTFGYVDIPRYGLIINPFENTAIKVNRGKHFKAPSPNDLFWPYEDFGYGMGAQGNKDLKPETGWHTDATLEQTFFNNKMFLTCSYFKWDIDDKITWIPDANFFYRPQNLNSYEATGWEAGTKIGPFYNVTVSLNYTNTDAKEKMEGGAKRQALYTPDDQFKGSVTYGTDFGLTTTATARYVGYRPAYYANVTDTRPTKTLSHYWTADLKLEQRLFNHWVLTLQGNNLFDKGYETYVTNFYDSTGASTLAAYPGAGRSVFASVKYEF